MHLDPDEIETVLLLISDWGFEYSLRADRDKVEALKAKITTRQQVAKEQAEKIAAHPYVYCNVECQRKAWHLGNEFDDWDQIGFDRGDFTEDHTFRKLRSALAEKDKELIERYGAIYFPLMHDEMVREWEAEKAKSKA